jgi:hypothetical protein
MDPNCILPVGLWVRCHRFINDWYAIWVNMTSVVTSCHSYNMPEFGPYTLKPEKNSNEKVFIEILKELAEYCSCYLTSYTCVTYRGTCVIEGAKLYILEACPITRNKSDIYKLDDSEPNSQQQWKTEIIYSPYI